MSLVTDRMNDEGQSTMRGHGLLRSVYSKKRERSGGAEAGKERAGRENKKSKLSVNENKKVQEN